MTVHGARSLVFIGLITCPPKAPLMASRRGVCTRRSYLEPRPIEPTIPHVGSLYTLRILLMRRRPDGCRELVHSQAKLVHHGRVG
eukprot:CAMPEP_0174704330 /NCGR_PEP_ID=MMETSP1094-20130205/7969_1 /TAXON_ID=156173 /ORGANISM="Chrysochromulina brevifilum, Strain UTEX LB 985" /LENGTH=84 /DNA_ID=CAMNT_0015902379 /DNA_START=289 /DNA_END=540 /DNA_ORIENTATION=+